MNTITKVFNVYEYDELSDDAREKVERWFLEDPVRNDIFYDYIKESLKNMFPRSDLDVIYSLGYCQGDGLNIQGKLYYYDFIDKWLVSDKTRRTMCFYIDKLWDKYYMFEKNDRYTYSCKFIDLKYVDCVVDEIIDELTAEGVRSIKENVIKMFLTDMIDHFEELDCSFKEEGYKYFYEPDKDEIKYTCEANGWFFLEDGTFYQ